MLARLSSPKSSPILLSFWNRRGLRLLQAPQLKQYGLPLVPGLPGRRIEMPATPTESTFELTTIERLKKLGYRYQHGGEVEHALHAVVLEEPLRTQLSWPWTSSP